MNKLTILVTLLLIILLSACGDSGQSQVENVQQPRSPVEVTSIHQGSISNQLTLFGSTMYLKRNVVTSPIPAFITDVHIKLGDKVNKGDLLYNLETKERRALGQQPLAGDTSLATYGKIEVRASFSGIISTLDKQQLGDYVLEGSQLCTIAESNNLAVQINVPYEYTPFAKAGRTCTLILPDEREVSATITTPLTTMNAVAQTQTILAKPNTTLFLPENLIVKVILITNEQKNTNLLPRSAVLTDEMMQEYWVMKMINDSMAVKVPVRVGEKSKDEVEIVSPLFLPEERIIVKGNYGLPDTARVVIGMK
jgi:multidrug efflux pump subunit AcrA (membrane-fusion protein)